MTVPSRFTSSLATNPHHPSSRAFCDAACRSRFRAIGCGHERESATSATESEPVATQPQSRAGDRAVGRARVATARWCCSPSHLTQRLLPELSDLLLGKNQALLLDTLLHGGPLLVRILKQLASQASVTFYSIVRRLIAAHELHN